MCPSVMTRGEDQDNIREADEIRATMSVGSAHYYSPVAKRCDRLCHRYDHQGNRPDVYAG